MATSQLNDNAKRRRKWLVPLILGVIVGLLLLFAYMLRMHTYIIGDDPAACVNCHIMTPYYATWSHSSHGRDATCNDCHVPHQNVVKKYFFKGKDGMKHVGYFLTRSEHQAIMAEDASAQVIMDNCIRCHSQLNQEFIKSNRMGLGYMEAKRGEGKACWDCHRNVPHGGMNSLSSTDASYGVTPIPPSPVPEWLQRMVPSSKINR